jgi:acyl carrier protein
MQELNNWLAAKIAEESNTPLSEIDMDKKFEEYYLDSLSTVTILFDLEKDFNYKEINPSAFSEYNTINKFAEWIQVQK